MEVFYGKTAEVEVPYYISSSKSFRKFHEKSSVIEHKNTEATLSISN